MGQQRHDGHSLVNSFSFASKTKEVEEVPDQ